VWEPFQQRFDIPTIREFYSATEAPGAIFNLSGKVGSIGHVPFRRLGPLKLARYDVDRDELVHDARGLCIECAPGEVGELLIRLPERPRSALADFKGYTDAGATQKKILSDVFRQGDRFFRSGDLMRFDDNDYFYFVDRIGDTYRWKGENVSTAEVAEVISTAPGVQQATVSGVVVPGAEGQAGLAAVVCEGAFDAGGFWQTAQELPAYAQPRFVRVLEQMQTTGTFKIQKTQLRADGVDPGAVADPIYVRQDDGYVPLTAELWQKVLDGELRL
jgi:fatty-acyl-CoA synthase